MRRGWFPAGLSGYADGFAVERVPGEPCLVIRHDLDGLEEADVAALMEGEAELGVRSTCFVLEDQLRQILPAARRLRDGGWDLQCHSQARGLVLEIDDARWVEWRYRTRLRRAERRWRRQGWPVEGHAPHGAHNYLGLHADANWDLIEAATIGSGFSWVSSYRAITKTAPGQPFPWPAAPYLRRHRKTGRRVLVMPTAWEDRFFSPSWEDRWMNRPGRTLAEARMSVLPQIEACEEAGIPYVVSLHPVLFLRGGRCLYPWEFEAWLVETCRGRGFPVRTCSDVAAPRAGGPG